MRWLAIIVLLVGLAACKKKSRADFPPELAKLAPLYDDSPHPEAPIRYPKIVLTTDGLFVDRKPIAPLAGLASDKVKAALGSPPPPNDDDFNVIVFYPGLPAAAIQAVLRGVAESKWQSISLTNADFENKKLQTICNPRLYTSVTTDAARPQVLSIDYRRDRIFVGRSIANEFYEIVHREGGPDTQKLVATLKELAAAGGFGLDHPEQPIPISSTVEYAADPAISGDDYLHVLESFCCREFCDLAIVPPDKLTARAQL